MACVPRSLMAAEPQARFPGKDVEPAVRQAGVAAKPLATAAVALALGRGAHATFGAGGPVDGRGPPQRASALPRNCGRRRGAPDAHEESCAAWLPDGALRQVLVVELAHGLEATTPALATRQGLALWAAQQRRHVSVAKGTGQEDLAGRPLAVAAAAPALGQHATASWRGLLGGGSPRRQARAPLASEDQLALAQPTAPSDPGLQQSQPGGGVRRPGVDLAPMEVGSGVAGGGEDVPSRRARPSSALLASGHCSLARGRPPRLARLSRQLVVSSGG